VPAAVGTLFDTWQVSGLRGTGSIDFEVHGVVVPHARAVSADLVPRLATPLYRTQSFFCIGHGAHALDAFAELAASKTAVGTRRVLREQSRVQKHVAHAEAQHRAAERYLYGAVGDV
jgi:indole-3-acetate monooxygenase